MANEESPIEFQVQTHPSGHWTLTARQGRGIFEQIDGELLANDDPAAFYRAVARHLGALGPAGVVFTYQDMDL